MFGVGWSRFRFLLDSLGGESRFRDRLRGDRDSLWLSKRLWNSYLSLFSSVLWIALLRMFVCWSSCVLIGLSRGSGCGFSLFVLVFSLGSICSSQSWWFIFVAISVGRSLSSRSVSSLMHSIRISSSSDSGEEMCFQVSQELHLSSSRSKGGCGL